MDIEKIREALADYMATEGCTCCQNIEAHTEAAKRLGKLLGIPTYTDGSGIDFWQFRSYEPDPLDDQMDGDHASALASAGWGTDEDYGG
jgi:Fe-S oxidoreductase